MPLFKHAVHTRAIPNPAALGSPPDRCPRPHEGFRDQGLRTDRQVEQRVPFTASEDIEFLGNITAVGL